VLELEAVDARGVGLLDVEVVGVVVVGVDDLDADGVELPKLQKSMRSM